MNNTTLESFIDFCDIMEIAEESLEYSLTHMGSSKSITLYHGSTLYLPSINPSSPNSGTRLSKPRCSSFWADNEDAAFMWGMTPLYIDTYIPFIQELGDGIIWFLEEDRDKVEKLYEKAVVYVYSVTIPTKYVGVGQDRKIKEYTIDIAVKYDSCKKFVTTNLYEAVKKKDSDALAKQGIYFISDPETVKDFKEKTQDRGFWEYTSDPRKLNLMEKMIYRKDWGRRRQSLYYSNLNGNK